MYTLDKVTEIQILQCVSNVLDKAKGYIYIYKRREIFHKCFAKAPDHGEKNDLLEMIILI